MYNLCLSTSAILTIRISDHRLVILLPAHAICFTKATLMTSENVMHFSHLSQ